MLLLEIRHSDKNPSSRQLFKSCWAEKPKRLTKQSWLLVLRLAAQQNVNKILVLKTSHTLVRSLEEIKLKLDWKPLPLWPAFVVSQGAMHTAARTKVPSDLPSAHLWTALGTNFQRYAYFCSNVKNVFQRNQKLSDGFKACLTQENPWPICKPGQESINKEETDHRGAHSCNFAKPISR